MRIGLRDGPPLEALPLLWVQEGSTEARVGLAILAELAGERWLQADAATLATIRQLALLVTAADSPPEFHAGARSDGHALPNARNALVGDGPLIDPAAPDVLAFIAEVLESR
jgi:hypothetical protein